MTKLSPESTSLLETARREYLPSEEARRRIRERILDGARAPIAPESSPASVAAGGARSGSSSMKTLGLASVCAFVLVSIFAVRATLEARSSAQGDDHATEAAPPTSEPRGAEAKREPSPASNDVPASEGTISPYLLPDAPALAPAKPSAGAVAARKPTAEAPAPGPVGTAESVANPVNDSLGNEMRILREAHAASKNGDPSRALTLLDEHARTYPRGVLREERLALTALVLCSQGRQADARRAAEELAHANPRSSHLERLRGSCVADATFSSKPSRE